MTLGQFTEADDVEGAPHGVARPVVIARECPGDNVIEIRELGGYA